MAYTKERDYIENTPKEVLMVRKAIDDKLRKHGFVAGDAEKQQIVMDDGMMVKYQVIVEKYSEFKKEWGHVIRLIDPTTFGYIIEDEARYVGVAYANEMFNEWLDWEGADRGSGKQDELKLNVSEAEILLRSAYLIGDKDNKSFNDLRKKLHKYIGEVKHGVQKKS